MLTNRHDKITSAPRCVIRKDLVTMCNRALIPPAYHNNMSYRCAVEVFVGPPDLQRTTVACEPCRVSSPQHAKPVIQGAAR